MTVPLPRSHTYSSMVMLAPDGGWRKPALRLTGWSTLATKVEGATTGTVMSWAKLSLSWGGATVICIRFSWELPTSLPL